MESGTASPVVASYIATFLKPEMLHLHRQITGLRRWRPVVLTQRREHADRFPFGEVVICRKPAMRFLRSVLYRHLRRAPIRAFPSEVRRILTEIERVRAEVLHVYFGHIGVYLLPLLVRRRLPAVVSFHGADAGVGMDRPAFRDPMRKLLGCVDRVLVRSESLARAVIGLGAEPDRVRVHRTGLPLERFPVEVREVPADGGWHWVQACRWVAKKGIGDALEAFARFAADHPGARFTLAGGGPMESELREAVVRLGLAGRVRFAGFLESEGLRELYRSAHLFVHPSLTGPDGNMEGVPNAMLEAMATGLPVLATRHGGIPEAVEDGVSGRLVGERDPRGLERAARELLGDGDRWAAAGAAAARAVRARFDLEVQSRLLEGFYDEAVKAFRR